MENKMNGPSAATDSYGLTWSKVVLGLSPLISHNYASIPHIEPRAPPTVTAQGTNIYLTSMPGESALCSLIMRLINYILCNDALTCAKTSEN